MKKILQIRSYGIGASIMSGEKFVESLLSIIDKEFIRNISVDKLCEMGSSFICTLAKYVEDAPIDKMFESICKLNESSYIELFAKILEDKLTKEQIDKLAIKVAESGDSYYIYAFACCVKNAPVDILGQAIAKSSEPEYIVVFAQDVENAPMELLQDSLCEIGNQKYIYYFARLEYEKTDLNKLAKAICKGKDGKYIYFFARDIPNAPIDILVDGICQTDKAEYIFFMAKKLEGRYIANLTDAICKTASYEYIYKISTIKGAPIKKLENRICELGSCTYILKFASFHSKASNKNINLNKLAKAMCDSYKKYDERKVLAFFESFGFSEKNKLKMLELFCKAGANYEVEVAYKKLHPNEKAKKILEKYNIDTSRYWK